jgi:hypothetical protein
MPKYSVLLLYPDYMAETYGEDTYFAHVTAVDPIEAVRRAQIQALNAQPRYIRKGSKVEDFKPLLVIAGHHDAMY